MKYTLITTALLSFALTVGSTAGAAPPPNIVLIMADDMGYGDAGCYNANSKIPTRNIDRLAKEGMRFTDAHSPAALCVQTRYGLMTGRYPFRAKTTLVNYDGLTVASLLKRAGYATGCVGKWHLGFDNKGYDKPLGGGPVANGFDKFFGIPASLDIPPYYYIENDRAVAAPSETIAANNSTGWSPIQGAFWRKGGVAPGFRHVDVLPKFAEKSVAFIDDQAKTAVEKPFFLYLALPAPHTPWMPLKKYLGKSKAGMYGDFAVQVDDVVGDVLNALDRHNLTKNTLVIFTSDNGPVWFAADVKRLGHASVGPLRGMKADAWEGGHRMPFIARWPGQIEAQSTCEETICLTDMLATFAAVTKQKLPASDGLDSYDITPLLLGHDHDSPFREATIHQSGRRVLAVRSGKWKLIPALGSGGFSKPSKVKPKPGGPRGQLYDMDADLGETKNLWSEHPEIVKRLTGLLEGYRKAGRSAPVR